MTTVLLIRHGQTDHNANGRWQGHLDVPLNEVGKAQADALAFRLNDWHVVALYSSDLKRAAMTAVHLAGTWGLTPIYDTAWRERDVGVFQGLTNEEIQRKYPEAWAKVQNGDMDIPGGESHESLQSRAYAAYEKALNSYPGEMVAVVSHGGTLRTAVSHVLGISKTHYGNLNFRGNTGLTIVEHNSRGPRLMMLNDTRHLENDDYLCG